MMTKGPPALLALNHFSFHSLTACETEIQASLHRIHEKRYTYNIRFFQPAPKHIPNLSFILRRGGCAFFWSCACFPSEFGTHMYKHVTTKIFGQSRLPRVSYDAVASRSMIDAVEFVFFRLPGSWSEGLSAKMTTCDRGHQVDVKIRLPPSMLLKNRRPDKEVPIFRGKQLGQRMLT